MIYCGAALTARDALADAISGIQNEYDTFIEDIKSHEVLTIENQVFSRLQSRFTDFQQFTGACLAIVLDEVKEIIEKDNHQIPKASYSVAEDKCSLIAANGREIYENLDFLMSQENDGNDNQNTTVNTIVDKLNETEEEIFAVLTEIVEIGIHPVDMPQKWHHWQHQIWLLRASISRLDMIVEITPQTESLSNAINKLDKWVENIELILKGKSAEHDPEMNNTIENHWSSEEDCSTDTTATYSVLEDEIKAITTKAELAMALLQQVPIGSTNEDGFIPPTDEAIENEKKYQIDETFEEIATVLTTTRIRLLDQMWLNWTRSIQEHRIKFKSNVASTVQMSRIEKELKDITQDILKLEKMAEYRKNTDRQWPIVLALSSKFIVTQFCRTIENFFKISRKMEKYIMPGLSRNHYILDTACEHFQTQAIEFRSALENGEQMIGNNADEKSQNGHDCIIGLYNSKNIFRSFQYILTDVAYYRDPIERNLHQVKAAE